MSIASILMVWGNGARFSALANEQILRLEALRREEDRASKTSIVFGAHGLVLSILLGFSGQLHGCFSSPNPV